MLPNDCVSRRSADRGCRQARPSDSAIGASRAGFLDWTHFSSDLLLRKPARVGPSPAFGASLRISLSEPTFAQSTFFSRLVGRRWHSSSRRTHFYSFPRSTGRDNRGRPGGRFPFRGGPTFARSTHTHNAFAAHTSSMGGSNKIVEFGKYRKRSSYGFWPLA